MNCSGTDAFYNNQLTNPAFKGKVDTKPIDSIAVTQGMIEDKENQSRQKWLITALWALVVAPPNEIRMCLGIGIETGIWQWWTSDEKRSENS